MLSGTETPTGALILVVDDDHHDLFMLQRRLEGQNYRVQTASSGKNALDQAQRLKPDMILLDATMPDMDGYAVKQALNQHDGTREIPVIFLSSRSQIDFKVKAFEVGGDDFLAKPVHPEELLARMGVVLRRQRREHDLLDEIERLEATLRGGGVEIADEAEALEKLDKSLQLADTRREPVACLLLKINGLENLNNPSLVRMVIVETSGSLQEMANASTDTVLTYREEGEYLFYAVGMSIKRAQILAEGLKSSIMVKAFSDPAAEQRLSVSLGITGRDYGQRITKEAMLKGVEEALAGAVAAGGNRISLKRLKESAEEG